MKKYLTTTVCAIIVMVNTFFLSTAYAQIKLHMPQQERTFRKGMELYNNGKFEEAIQCFEIIFNDDEVYDNRYQLSAYALMWIGNSLVHLDQRDKALDYNPMALLYSGSEPINPDKMVEIDSLSHAGLFLWRNYNDESDLEQALEIYKCRQRKLENALGKNHLWTNGGREILVNIYKEYYNVKFFKNSESFDANSIIEISDSIAELANEIRNCLNYNFHNAIDKSMQIIYYQQLMYNLGNLCDVLFINNYHDINFKIIDDLNSLFEKCPYVIQSDVNHYLNGVKYIIKCVH